MNPVGRRRKEMVRQVDAMTADMIPTSYSIIFIPWEGNLG